MLLPTAYFHGHVQPSLSSLLSALHEVQPQLSAQSKISSDDRHPRPDSQEQLQANGKYMCNVMYIVCCSLFCFYLRTPYLHVCTCVCVGGWVGGWGGMPDDHYRLRMPHAPVMVGVLLHFFFGLNSRRVLK